MKDYLLKIGTTKLKYILRGGYEIQEDQEIVLAKITTADGTERRNIAEKRSIHPNIFVSKTLLP